MRIYGKETRSRYSCRICGDRVEHEYDVCERHATEPMDERWDDLKPNASLSDRERELLAELFRYPGEKRTYRRLVNSQNLVIDRKLQELSGRGLVKWVQANKDYQSLSDDRYEITAAGRAALEADTARLRGDFGRGRGHRPNPEHRTWDQAYKQAREMGADDRAAREFADEQVEADQAHRFRALGGGGYDENARVRKECADCGHHVSVHQYDPGSPRSGPQRCSVSGCPCFEFRRPGFRERIKRHPNISRGAEQAQQAATQRALPKPRFCVGDPVMRRDDPQRHGEVTHVNLNYDEVIGGYRYKVLEPSGAHTYWNEGGMVLAQRSNASQRERGVSVLAGHSDPGAGTPIANPSQVDFFEDNRFVREGPLWQLSFGAYGSTHVYVWADGAESAFEEAVEWLDDNAPGMLVMVGEEDYQRAADELGKVWDPSEPDYEVIETAEADMTMIGHTTLKHGNAVASWEWQMREIERGSDEWNDVVERSREESGDEYEENASRSQDVVSAALNGRRMAAGSFRTAGGVIYSYDMPIADVRNADGPFYVLDKSRSPSVTTSKHIGYVHTWLRHIKSWIQPEVVSEIQI